MSIFFMLSGFLLAYRYADSKSSFKQYFINRFARIYPVYAVAALVTLPWIGINAISNPFNGIGSQHAQLGLLLVSNILLIQAWFPPYFSLWNDGGSWSISVEVFCHLILPVILPILLKATKKQIYVTTLICYFLAVVPGLTVLLFDHPSNSIYYSLPIYRFPEFLIGVCIFLAIRLGNEYRHEVITQIIVVSLFALYLGMLGNKLPLWVGHNWLALPVIGLMIGSLSTDRGLIAKMLSNPALVWLGKVSYSFYSFQALILLFLVKYHETLTKDFPVLLDNEILALSSFIVLLIFSAVGYYLIENPARKWIKAHWADKH